MVVRIIYSKLFDFSNADVKENVVKGQMKTLRFNTKHVPETLPCVPGHRRKLSVFENYICC